MFFFLTWKLLKLRYSPLPWLFSGHENLKVDPALLKVCQSHASSIFKDCVSLNIKKEKAVCQLFSDKSSERGNRNNFLCKGKKLNCQLKNDSGSHENSFGLCITWFLFLLF